jgi:hypothetical protein
VGGLLGGDITLYVDNTNGDLTADELARIQDAVTAADAVTESYGVAVSEVTDPTLADVTLNMDITSAVGGFADGVLGCTTDAGQITIISGWNFYAGSNPTQIGSTQYDFQTVVTHELGHALGLGHSADSTSVMYATLSAGTLNRGLTTADLNVPDTDAGACGLHALPSYLAPTSAGSLAAVNTAAIGMTLAFNGDDSARNLLFALLGREQPFAGPDVNLTRTPATNGAAALSPWSGPARMAANFPTPAFSPTSTLSGRSLGSIAAAENGASDKPQETRRNRSEPADGPIPAADPEVPAASWLRVEPAIDLWRAAGDDQQLEPADSPSMDAGLAWAGVLGLLLNAEITLGRVEEQKHRITVDP